MVCFGQGKFIRYRIELFQQKAKLVLEKIYIYIKEKKYADEFEYIQKEINNMLLDINFNPTYLYIINELNSVDINLLNEIKDLYFDFVFCKSLIKNKINTKNMSNKNIFFIKEANEVLDLIINNIINCYQNNDNDNIILLQKIKYEVECMKLNLSFDKYKPNYVRNIIDNFNLDNNLCNRLLKLNKNYLEL